MSVDKSAKWFTAIPLVYRSDEPGFWTREAGLLCLGFRELGIDSRFVTLGESRVHEERPVISAPLENLLDPAWWKQWGITGVVLYSWAAPRFEPIARAIKASGAKLVLRLDSDGLNSPLVWWSRYLNLTYWALKDEGKPLPALRAFAKTILSQYFPGVYHRPWQQHLSHADLLVIESTLAKQRYRRLLADTGRPDLAERLRVIPPQIWNDYTFDPKIAKEPIIVAVGRWATAQKDAPMLLQVLGRVLAMEPGYTAIVAGSGESLLQQWLARLPPAAQPRIRIAGKLPAPELRSLYQRARIVFFSSRYEGFPNVACEALCCGCSVVGPAMIASMNDCVAHGSGTLACHHSVGAFSDALSAEIEAWAEGARDPQAISRRWWPRVTAPEVAGQILHLIGQSQAPTGAAQEMARA
jgi:glycosyltransferase involved in cell wall biosynthesis